MTKARSIGGVYLSSRSISGYNTAAKQGKAAALKYCQAWQLELTKEGVELATNLTSKKIDKNTYNIKRESLNNKTKELNECIQAINRQFGN